MRLDWTQIIVNLITNSAFIAFVVFISKFLIENWSSKNIEKYKAELRATNTREIEKFRMTLERTTLEYKIQFTSLHEKRAEIIAQLYQKLVQIRSSLESLNYILATGHFFRNREFGAIQRVPR